MARASIWSAGPALTYYRFLGQNPVFLGTFEQRPEIQIDRAFMNVKNDLFGSELPADRSYQGKEASVAGVLNRFNMQSMIALQSPPAAVLPAQVVGGADAAIPANGAGLANDGSDLGSTYGTLMTQEAKGVELWVLFPRFVNVPGLIPGYHFLSAFLLGPDKISAGSGDLKETVIFKCQRSVTVLNKTALTMTLNVYDHDMSAVTPLALAT